MPSRCLITPILLAFALVLSFVPSAQAAFTHLAFSDEFNGTTADLSQKWTLKGYCNFGPGAPQGQSQACFTPSQASEGNSLLDLRATYQPACGGFSCWLTAQVESRQAVIPPLKVVVRAKVAPGVGMWSSPNWMSNGCVEVDGVEQLNRQPYGVNNSVHRWSCTGSHVGHTEFANTAWVLANGFHNYVAKVYADRVEFLVDGVLTNTITQAEVAPWQMLHPMTFKASLNVGTCWSWAGCPNYTNSRDMLVDWYRVLTP